jgi:hypothetical protein
VWVRGEDDILKASAACGCVGVGAGRGRHPEGECRVWVCGCGVAGAVRSRAMCKWVVVCVCAQVADLREAAARLERKLTERTRELEALQPLKVQLRRTETGEWCARSLRSHAGHTPSPPLSRAAELDDANKHITRLQGEVLELRRELARQVGLTRAAVQSNGDRGVLDASTAVRVTEGREREAGGGGSRSGRPGSGVDGRPGTSGSAGSGGLGLATASHSSLPGSTAMMTAATAAALMPSALSVGGGGGATVAFSSGTGGVGGWADVVTDKLRSITLGAAAAVVPGMDFLCARCNASLQAAIDRQEYVPPGMDTAAAKILLGQLAGAGTARGPHIPCKMYRLMLPPLPPLAPDVVRTVQEAASKVEAAKLPPKPLEGSIAPAQPTVTADDPDPLGLNALDIPYPKRPVAWTRWIMRAVLLAKMRDDSIAALNRPDGATAPGRRMRFPEFVFGWFEGGGPVSSAAATNAKLMAPWMGAAGHAAARSTLAGATGAGGAASGGGGGDGGAAGTSATPRPALAPHPLIAALAASATPGGAGGSASAPAAAGKPGAGVATGVQSNPWGITPTDEVRPAVMVGGEGGRGGRRGRQAESAGCRACSGYGCAMTAASQGTQADTSNPPTPPPTPHRPPTAGALGVLLRPASAGAGRRGGEAGVRAAGRAPRRGRGGVRTAHAAQPGRLPAAAVQVGAHVGVVRLWRCATRPARRGRRPAAQASPGRHQPGRLGGGGRHAGCADI